MRVWHGVEIDGPCGLLIRGIIAVLLISSYAYARCLACGIEFGFRRLPYIPGVLCCCCLNGSYLYTVAITNVDSK